MIALESKENLMSDELPGLRWYQLLMLAVSIIGNEGSSVYAQIYSILTLEYLGVPTSLATMSGAIGGGIAMFIIPLSGTIMDKGNNPKKRKMMAVIACAVLFITSLSIMMTAGLLKAANQTYDAKIRNNSNQGYQAHAIYNEQNRHQLFFPQNITSNNHDNVRLHVFPRLEANITQNDTTDVSLMPTTGILGIIAFSLIDLGFDLGNPIYRAFALDHTPVAQQKDVLMMVTFLAPLAGVLVSMVGIIDFAEVLGNAFNTDGTAAVLVFFAILLIFVIFSCTLCSVLTGIWISKTKGHILCARDSPQQNVSKEEKDITLTCKGKSSVYQDSANPHVKDQDGSSKEDEIEPNRRKEETKELEPETNITKNTIDSGIENNVLIPKQKCYKTFESESRYRSNSNDMPSEKSTSGVQYAKSSSFFSRKLIIVTISTGLSAFAMIHFTIYASYSLTVGVFHTDPQDFAVEKGGNEFTKSLRFASLGSTIFYSSYFITSVMTKKLIKIADEKILFFAWHALHATSTALFAYFQRMELFYVAMATCGGLRWAFFTIPYILANEYTNESMGPELGVGQKSKAGRVVSVISLTGAIDYFISCSYMGPLLEATDNAWLPMIFCSVSATFAAFTILSLFFVK